MDGSFGDRNWMNDVYYFVKNIWIMIVSLIVGIVVAIVAIAGIPPVYRAHATYYLNKSELNSAFFTINEFQFYNLLLLDIEKLIGSRSFYNAVKNVSGIAHDMDELTYEDYLEHLYIEFDTDSTFFEVGFESTDSDLAMSISSQIERILSREAAKIIRISTVENVDASYLSDDPVAPDKFIIILLGGIMGAFIGISLILLRFLMSKDLKTHIEAEIISGKNILSYSRFNMKKKNIMHFLNTINHEDYYVAWQTINNDIAQYHQKLYYVVTCDDTGKNEAFALTLANHMGKTYEKTLFIPINPSTTFSSILTYSYGHENRLIKALNRSEPLSKLIRNVSYSFDILIGTDNRIAFDAENMEKLEALLDEVETQYDLIMISVSAETLRLSPLAKRGAVLLAASGNSNRDKVRHIVKNLKELEIRFLGIAYQL